jgi:hypothetical protein
MTEIPVACTLSNDALAQRQEELKTLRQRICEKRHIPNGFALRFEGSTENLMVIAQVMAQERLCCRFLQFKLIAEPDMGSIWLEVSGLNDNTRFLLTLFGFDEVCCDSPCFSSQC